MRTLLTQLQPSPWLTRKLLMLAILVGVGVAAFFMGRRQNAAATPPDAGLVPTMSSADMAEYNRRVVAYVYDNVAVTRAELGEYLIARFGGERLEFLVNRKIVEMECRKYNIFASDAEVEQRFQQDLRSFGTPLTEQDFVNNILRRFGKTLYEWKEDVIRPKIMMEKLVESKVQITDNDLREGFEARFGPKVECRMIVLDSKGGSRAALEVYENARKGHAEFMVEARKQFIPNLAQTEGKVPPIHKHFGDKKIEGIAFSMKVGQVSSLIQMEDKTYVILYCEKHLPADAKAKFEDERLRLSKEMRELRLAQKIPEEFKQLHDRAQPRYMIAKQELRTTSPVSMPTRPVSKQSAETPRIDMPPLNPQPVSAPPGLTPLAVPNTPLPAPNLAPPALPSFTPPEKK